MGLPVRHPDHPYSYGDYLSWPEDTRDELVNGVAFAMPAPNRRHQEIVGNLFLQIASALEAHPCHHQPRSHRRAVARRAHGRARRIVASPPHGSHPDRLLAHRCRHGRPDVHEPKETLNSGLSGRMGYVARVAAASPNLSRSLRSVRRAVHLARGHFQCFLKGTTGSRVLPEVVIDWDRSWRVLD